MCALVAIKTSTDTHVMHLWVANTILNHRVVSRFALFVSTGACHATERPMLTLFHAHTQEREISVLLKRVSVLQEEANTHGK